MRRTRPSFSTELASVLAPTIRLSVSLAFILVAVYDMIQGTRMTKTLQYISVKNKGFLAGDRFKKRIFYSPSRKFRREVFFGTPSMYKWITKNHEGSSNNVINDQTRWICIYDGLLQS